MGKLLSLLRNRATGGVLVMLTVIVLILLLGRQFRLSLVIQLVAIIAVLLIGMIVLVIGYMRANKSSSAIEQSIRVQAEQQAQSVRPDKQAEIKQLQEELDRAITKLKQSKLGGGRRGRAALYALPWYMMIGPPAAGKTTAIANSGLSFPIGLDAIRGVGGTRNCDWFFSDSAIILDTAGRYVTEPEDQEEWNAFLETLRTNRRRQPINGVIVAISIDELADATADQIDRHAVTIRRKIDDLVTRLDVKFPVYLMFTKCDLLRGFVQFFGELGRQERERVWGCTLDRIRSQEEEVGALFEKETDRLFQHLVNMRSARLARAMKREDRQLVYVFPLEFASVKDKLKGFVSRLFQPNPYQESPTFRGFYFSSGTQEGIPIDRVIRVIAEKFEFVGAPLQDEEPVKQTKSYFIKDLFTRVVIPDRYLVSQTSRAAVRGSFMKAGVGIAAVVLLGLFILGAGQALVRSQIRLNRVAEVATEAAPVQADVPVLAGEDLGRLENLRVVLADLEDEPLFGWGLDQRDEVREPVRTIFYGKMRQTIGTGAFRLLQSRARSALQGAR
ncbi:MAG: type VI secretion system membrane subunit TssM, partial [Rhodothermia bacterium]|nr:type VI secretion system membrane subunit TssM [Rhodothermia bacterium]